MSCKYPVITLLTDFGIKDAYVSTMKGIILQICPAVKIIDVSHNIPRHNVIYGSFLLLGASPYFPSGTIHVAVVDPGVGTARRRIVIQGRHSFYVGPDNGILSLSARKEGIKLAVEVREKRFMLPQISNTFEGRDVFAPISAYLARGTEIQEFGPEIKDLEELTLKEAIFSEEKILGEILHIDTFKNIITNIPKNLLNEAKITENTLLRVSVGKNSQLMRFCKAYGEVPAKMPLIIIGSSDFLEIAVNQGSASILFKAKIGDDVIVVPY
ncbi:MAG: hypothetical protein QG670_1124 [Thermoproteota archaeon]|nr:hypothetical protein [Thermoproteota archaeon]